jgi:hypothetical protein
MADMLKGCNGCRVRTSGMGGGFERRHQLSRDRGRVAEEYTRSWKVIRALAGGSGGRDIFGAEGEVIGAVVILGGGVGGVVLL